MKSSIIKIAMLALAVGILSSCSDWTEPSAMKYNPSKSASYYKQLRAWKQAKNHPVTFGYYGNWTGTGASLNNSLMGLPDSVDFVSMWGNWWGLSPAQKADKKQVKELKGTKVLMCFIISDIGDQVTPKHVRDNWQADGFATAFDAVKAFWGWKDGDETAIEQAIRKYVDAIADTMVKYDFDGFDFDLETHYAIGGNKTICGDAKKVGIVIDQFSKYCGPRSGTERMLCVDGEPFFVPAEYADAIDYYILQAYYTSSYTNTDARVLGNGDGWGSPVKNFLGKSPLSKEEIIRRTILVEDFEQNAEGGGRAGSYTTRDGRTLPPILGLASYATDDGIRIGGAGIYHMEYDYKNSKGIYYYLRGITHILNTELPAATPPVE